MRPSRRDYVRLSWLVDSDVANAELKNGYIIQLADLTCTEKALALCADERSKIAEVRTYLAPDAWIDLKSKVDGFDVNNTLCSVCVRRSGVGNSAKVKWVQCDGCIEWNHVSCTALTRKPRGYWYCQSCA